MLYIADGHHRSASASRVVAAAAPRQKPPRDSRGILPRRDPLRMMNCRSSTTTARSWILTVSMREPSLKKVSRALHDVDRRRTVNSVPTGPRVSACISTAPAVSARPWRRKICSETTRWRGLDVSLLQDNLIALILGIRDCAHRQAHRFCRRHPRPRRARAAGGLREDEGRFRAASHQLRAARWRSPTPAR